MCPKDEDRMANSVDLDQTEEQSDLGLHCLPRLVCPKLRNITVTGICTLSSLYTVHEFISITLFQV